MRRARLGVFAISFVVLTILVWSTIIQHPLQLDTPTDQQSAPASARSDAEQMTYINDIASDTEVMLAHNGLRLIQRPEWRQDDRLIHTFDDLAKQARNGDMVASFVLGMNLRHCYFVPDDNAALAEKLLQASEFKDNGLALADIQQRYDYCEGVARSDRNRFYYYLERSAAKGNVPAQEAIAELTPQLYMTVNNLSELGRDDYVEKRQSFVSQQVDFLTSAAQHGSLKALIKLSQLHYAQTVGEDGRLQAYAFNEIILALADDTQLQNRYYGFQRRAENDFTAEELEQARKIAENWLEIIKTNGTLFLNENSRQ